MNHLVVQHDPLGHPAPRTLEYIAPTHGRLAGPGAVALLGIEIQAPRPLHQIIVIAEQTRQGRLFDGEGGRSGRKALDIGLGLPGGLDKVGEIPSGHAFARGQIKLRAIQAFFDQENLQFAIILQVA
jgi:hypothetical protein